jgi:hypothetical protein
MDIFKRLFGGGGSGASGNRSSGDPNGLYFYVKPNGCDEIVRVRIDRNNDLSLDDDNKSYVVHKLARGTKCFQTVEVDLYFDQNRRLVNSELQHGVMVTEDDYQAWIAQSTAPTNE